LGTLADKEQDRKKWNSSNQPNFNFKLAKEKRKTPQESYYDTIEQNNINLRESQKWTLKKPMTG